VSGERNTQLDKLRRKPRLQTSENSPSRRFVNKGKKRKGRGC
jgi:hypothetical protein